MQSIKRVVIHEAVVSEIVKYIKEKSLKKGDKLPTEKELINILNVSRTSVREALKVLKANGIVNIVHGSGIYVNTTDGIMLGYYDTDREFKQVLLSLKELAQARIMLETFCALEVSKYILPEQLADLYAYEETENNFLSNSRNQSNNAVFISLGLELLLTKLYGNNFLLNFHERIEELWKKYLITINSMPYPSELRHEDHMNIIKSIESKNKDKIKKNVQHHIQRMIDALNDLL